MQHQLCSFSQNRSCLSSFSTHFSPVASSVLPTVLQRSLRDDDVCEVASSRHLALAVFTMSSNVQMARSGYRNASWRHTSRSSFFDVFT